ncbi:MAG: HAD-IC family P-type ATPase, partial [Clostridia bacterium]|nr:HAD-IC family P-type ATPase [Clostridia bacterium]
VERLSKTDVFVFDKTGTLTKGEFAVEGVYPESKRAEILKYACICEKDSNHPIAKSVLKEYDGDIPRGFSTVEIAGKGIIARSKNETVICGNRKLLEENGVIAEVAYDGFTSLYISVNGTFLGKIVVADAIREESFSLIDRLKKDGDKVCMFTGDNRSSADRVAKKLGIENYKFSMLPQDKTDSMEEILSTKKKGDVVAFVGDGINDAPVIMRADVGVSMGGIGSDSAIEASDVVLMHDDPSAILTARKIAKKTMRIVKENVVFALLVKFSALVLSAVGIGGMWYAVFADVGVSVIAILNAMRAMSVKSIKN